MGRKMRNGFAPRSPNPIKAWVSSRIPQSNPPEKIAAITRAGAPPSCSELAEAVDVVTGSLSFASQTKIAVLKNDDSRPFIRLIKPFGNLAPSN
jgi:hypothetical protein